MSSIGPPAGYGTLPLIRPELTSCALQGACNTRGPGCGEQASASPLPHPASCNRLQPSSPRSQSRSPGHPGPSAVPSSPCQPRERVPYKLLRLSAPSRAGCSGPVQLGRGRDKAPLCLWALYLTPAHSLSTFPRALGDGARFQKAAGTQEPGPGRDKQSWVQVLCH